MEFLCELCDKKYSLKKCLNRHIQSAHGERVLCDICGKQLSRKDKLLEHKRTYHTASIEIACAICHKKFSKNYNLLRHLKKIHTVNIEEPIASTSNENSKVLKKKFCDSCKKEICESKWSYHLRTNAHKKNAAEPINEHLKVVKSCFDERIESYIFENKDESILDPIKFFDQSKLIILNALEDSLLKHEAFKFNMELFGEYIKVTRRNDDEDDDFIISIKSFQSKMNTIKKKEELEKAYIDMSSKIYTKMQEFQERDSGWTLIRIIHVEININQWKPLKGTQYIPLPKCLIDKKACINVHNNDEYCFKWAIISALYPVESHSDRISSYQVEDIKAKTIILSNDKKIEFGDLEFPFKVNDCKKFELLNPTISINVFGYEDEGRNKCKIIGPYYSTQEEKSTHINLLLLQEGDKYHYVWIKNVSRLVKSQITKSTRQIYICNWCLIHFYTEDALNIHKEECNKLVTKMPTLEKSILKFKHYNRQLDVPFVIYADFECILKNVSTCFPDLSGPSATDVQEHVPCAFSYYIKCSFDDSLSKLRIYKGEDCARKFVEFLVDDVRKLYNNYISKPIPMNSLTIDELEQQIMSRECHICKEYLGDDRVADHCHLTGKYRGPAHNECNLLFRVPKFFPIFFHNFSGYDCHLFVKELSSFEGDINVIPLNKELYISLSKRIFVNENDTVELRFLDSSRFMQASLNSLAKNLPIDMFKTVRSIFTNEEEFNLLTRKGVFPYEYINSWERLNENCLPSKENFYSKLTNSDCSDDDYEHAKNVWKTFNCQNIWNYLELYLITDVLLLTDVFENFRNVCKSIYSLDPCQYYTAPGLSWDAMLKVTKIELELLTDINMHTFIKRSIRGGITQCCHRHSIANNKYMKRYDEEKPSTYLMYVDANNLYGWAMSQYLPYGSFKWVEEIENIDVMNIPEDSDIGYILEVDLEYPESIHDAHNDLPFCAENKRTANAKHVKLITDLTNKKKYVIHYRNLQQCIKHGLRLVKIHRILQFKQSAWLKIYIDLNNHYRTLAKNTFEKNFFKLLNNAAYGKTMENVDKRKDVKIITEWENVGKKLGARALIAKPNFHSSTQFTSDMIAIQMNQKYTFYNKPIYLGFCVLELSKLKMYSFHYDYMKPKYNENIILNYMDTDSFVYTIQTEDFYNDIRNDIDINFDTSEYPLDNPYGLPLKNKKVLGMMKDENNGKIMTEFIGLRAKMYSLSVENSNDIKKIKGIKKINVNNISLENYRDCLYKKKLFYSNNMYIFRSKIHTIYTQMINKIALSFLDDKRYVKEDGVSTLAWGHYKLLNFNMDIDIN